MHYYDMVQQSKMNQQKMKEDAENQRLINETRQNKPAHPGYAPLLVKVGEVLSEIGDNLQERYKDWDAAAHSHPVSELIDSSPTPREA